LFYGARCCAGRRSYPRLLASVAVALILYCILSRWIGTATAFLTAFDGGAVVFLAAVWIMMSLATPKGMRRRAEIEDEGRYAVLGFSAAAAIAILLAIVFELHGIKDRPSARWLSCWPRRQFCSLGCL
jgi:uncharacterized membrane protein